jgi:hypothetical protein
MAGAQCERPCDGYRLTGPTKCSLHAPYVRQLWGVGGREAGSQDPVNDGASPIHIFAV